MNEPVTWIMPVKNGMPYLPLTLASIATQTYKNYSIIVWENGSTDGTVEELRRWIPARIPGVIVTDRVMSVGRSLAALVEAAGTELCARIDADDINEPIRLEKQVAHMRAHPEVVALGSQVRIIDAEGTPTGSPWECPTNDAEVRWLTRWQSGLTHPAVMFRKSAVLLAGNYADVESEDCELWIRLCPFGEIYSLPEVLLSYRRHAGSISGPYTDFFAGQLRSARNAAPHLFPGLPSEEALALWRITHPHKMDQAGHVSLKQLWRFSRAAALLATRSGKPQTYFKDTSTYRAQIYWLRKNVLQQCGLSKLMALRQYIRTRIKGAESANTP
ncbi:MAG TPA: glycosyltransferase [Bryobacteraceae bacterium]|jgi:glycosyltransferase involved in cell wall biosynthesis|nr:glycosyltransferase [Bryobacteraceae bacterium]